VRRSAELEMMDVPGQPRELLIDDLRNLRALNRCLGGYRNVLRGLTRVMTGHQRGEFSLLDVGAGSADVAASIARWARRRKLSARISCLEREEITVEQAAGRTRDFAEVNLVRGDVLRPPFAPASFDFILASQFLHHFANEQMVSLLRSWARLARRAIIVSDLVRHPLAYHGTRLLTRAWTSNVMTRTDAPLSVRRALTIKEWRDVFRQADVGRFTVEWVVPFRMRGVIWLEN
jgi:SAM-dependent methyltransferase